MTIGNAIVDVIARCEDDFLVAEDIQKGGMTLIDAERAAALYDKMGPAIETSGGSAANTAAGIASLGGDAAYTGLVAKDHLGSVFIHDIRSIGVHYQTPARDTDSPTAHCMIFVTPDGERSMSTFLGASIELGPEDINPDDVAASQITYFEGYLWDPPGAKEAILKAAGIAHKAGKRVAMTLSDSFCVDRYRDEFLALMREGTVDMVFANESELKSLYQTASFEQALSVLREDCPLGIVTRSEKGSVVVTREESHHVAAWPIDELVDTTGAGDLFAAGFLFGITRQYPLADCARIGSLCASEVIQHIGPRPQVPLSQLLAQSGISS